MAEPQEKPLNELLTHSLVDMYVGPQSTHWVLHEKLLCTRSPFFAKIFSTDRSYQQTPRTPSRLARTFGLPDDDADAFAAFVGWLYGGALPPPRDEPDLAPLFELYLMGEKWAVAALAADALDAVRRWYADSDSYPGLRRVQYVYANTADGSPMRQLLVGSVARMLVLRRPDADAPAMPLHWDKALRKNGQLAVDLIRAMQAWRIEAARVPDARRAPEELELADVKRDGLPADIERRAQAEGERVLEREREADEGEQTLVNGVPGDEEDDVFEDGDVGGCEGLPNGVRSR